MARTKIVIKRRVRSRRNYSDIVSGVASGVNRILRRPLSLFLIGLALLIILQPATLTKLIQAAVKYLGTNSLTTWLTDHQNQLGALSLMTGVVTGVAPQRDQWAIFLLGAIYATVATISLQTAFLVSFLLIIFYSTRGYQRAVPVFVMLFWLYSQLSPTTT